MWKYVLKRLLFMIPVIIGVIFLVFTILHFAPGDVTIQILGNQWTPEAAEALRHELGLDLPFFAQFFNYLKGIVRGDFGISYFSREPVINMLKVSFPNTVILCVTSVLLAVVISIPIGILAAVKPNSFFSTITTGFSLIGVSAPGFWVGLLLVLLFSLELGWLPASGLETPSAVIMPALVLSLSYLASMTRMMRSSMIEALKMDYVRTAKAKGVKEKIIIVKHALKNALLPTLTLIGFITGDALGGACVCETVFAIPGMGRLMVSSVQKRDINPVLGAVTVMAICVAVTSIITDVAYAYFDPRIKAQYVSGKRKT